MNARILIHSNRTNQEQMCDAHGTAKTKYGYSISVTVSLWWPGLKPCYMLSEASVGNSYAMYL